MVQLASRCTASARGDISYFQMFVRLIVHSKETSERLSYSDYFEFFSHLQGVDMKSIN